MPPANQNGPGIHYKIFWRRSEHDTEFQSLLLKEYGNVGVHVVRIQSEFYYTKYDVKVQVIILCFNIRIAFCSGFFEMCF